MAKPQIETIHPELQRAAGMIPQITFNSRNLRWYRFFIRLPWIQKTPKDILVKNVFIAGQSRNAQIRLRMYRPQSMVSSAPVLLWLHGGGYILGKPEQDDPCCIQYARELGIMVVSVDYQHAPEYPFPSAMEESYAALEWVCSHAEQLGIDANRIALGGASAGGGLAAALAQFTQELSEIHPVLQLLVYPMLDDRTSIRTGPVQQNHLLWSQESNRFGWESYLGIECGAAVVPPFSVPARCNDLAGLPPAWIGVGTLDLFYDEDIAYGQRLRDRGIACRTYIVPGAFHGFDLAGLSLQVVRDFRRSQIETLKQYLFA